MSLLDLPVDYDARMLDCARETLHDIPQCARAEYKLKWNEHAGSRVPVLWVVFQNGDLEAQLPRIYEEAPGSFCACVTVRLATMPSNTPMQGERAAALIRRSVEHYLLKHGIRILEPELVEVAKPPLIISAPRGLT